jgi:hypothetical protein
MIASRLNHAIEKRRPGAMGTTNRRCMSSTLLTKFSNIQCVHYSQPEQQRKYTNLSDQHLIDLFRSHNHMNKHAYFAKKKKNKHVRNTAYGHKWSTSDWLSSQWSSGRGLLELTCCASYGWHGPCESHLLEEPSFQQEKAKNTDRAFPTKSWNKSM